MLKYIYKSAACLLLFSLSITRLSAQVVKEPAAMDVNWSKPYQPFRIAGNLYYVGAYDLACYLITSPAGHILINTGLAASADIIKANIQTLGFKMGDIKILLTTQAHFDHMGAMAAIKKLTGAEVWVDAGDAGVLKDGGKSDYAMGGTTATYVPVIADRILHDKAVKKLGGMQLTLLHHPGHTKGSCSYLFTTRDDKRSYRVLIANMPTIVTDERFDKIKAYPTIAKDYAYTLAAMKKIQFDIWVASHASQFGLHEKRKPGDAYNPQAFISRADYFASLAKLQEDFNKKLKQK